MHRALRESLIKLDYIPLFPAWTVTNHMTVRTQEDVQNNNVFLRHLFKTAWNRQQRGDERGEAGASADCEFIIGWKGWEGQMFMADQTSKVHMEHTLGNFLLQHAWKRFLFFLMTQ